MSNTRKPNNPAPFTLADISAKMTPNQRVISLCVAGELFAEHQRLDNDLEEAQTAELISTGTRKINEMPPSRKIAEQIRKLEAAMKDEVYEFTFRQLKRAEWTSLLADHPPADPRTERVNRDTIRGPAVAACCVQPAGFDDPAVFAVFWDNLTTGQQDSLFMAAWEVNEGGISVPFSVNASVALSTSEKVSTSVAG